MSHLCPSIVSSPYERLPTNVAPPKPSYRRFLLPLGLSILVSSSVVWYLATVRSFNPLDDFQNMQVLAYMNQTHSHSPFLNLETPTQSYVIPTSHPRLPKMAPMPSYRHSTRTASPLASPSSGTPSVKPTPPPDSSFHTFPRASPLPPYA
jgi:hypothetical protein